MSTTVLLSATLRWQLAARLASTFGGLGCRIAIVCPRGHPAEALRGFSQTYPYSAFRPLQSLRHAIQASTPDLVVPCDDNAAMNMYLLYRKNQLAGSLDSNETALIERSLGSPAACFLATARGRMLEMALSEGIRVPDTRVLVTTGDLDYWLSSHAFPQVLKVDGSWGGLGVSIVHSSEDARRAYDTKAAGPNLLKAAMRTALDRDARPLLNVLRNERRPVTIQDHIMGTPANRAVACSRGEVLAGISVMALNTLHQTGPATVVKIIENSEMSEAAARLVKRLGISGLWGFDFMLEAGSGAAWLIEINPRATPICHLSMQGGPALPEMLCRSLTGKPPTTPHSMISTDVIAMFPGEWRRNPSSTWLLSAYHDVPWEEPGLVRDGIASPWEERGILVRLKNRLRPRRPQQTCEPVAVVALNTPAPMAIAQRPGF